MHEIHSRATMLAREASSREEELVAMKVVELQAALEARDEAVSGNKAWDVLQPCTPQDLTFLP